MENQLVEMLVVLPRDLVGLIFNFVDDAKTYEAISETNLKVFIRRS